MRQNAFGIRAARLFSARISASDDGKRFFPSIKLKSSDLKRHVARISKYTAILIVFAFVSAFCQSKLYRSQRVYFALTIFFWISNRFRSM